MIKTSAPTRSDTDKRPPRRDTTAPKRPLEAVLPPLMIDGLEPVRDAS